MFSTISTMTLLMLIPFTILIYTINFGRWMTGRKEMMGAVTAYLLGAVSFVVTGIMFWRIVA